MTRIEHNSKLRRRGAILIIAMFTLVVLTSLALVYARSIRVEALASANRFSAAQARAAAYGAAQAVLAMQLDTPAEGVEINGGVYWLLKPNYEDDQNYAFGLIDEAAKINLNSAPGEVLEMLRGMYTELADAIIDWRDTDSDVQASGAESEYYMLLDDPYEAKNEPFETVEELQLVRDISAAVLLGEDLNHNGKLDANEDDGAESDPPDNKDGKLDRGLFDLVTVFSSEPSSSKINVNSVSSSRGGGGRGNSGGGGGGGGDADFEVQRVLQENIGGARAEEIFDAMRRERPFRNIFDMYYKVQMTVDEFNRVEPFFTASRTSSSSSGGGSGGESGAGAEKIIGLVNINTAPKEVLMALPTLEEADADNIISRRASSSASGSSSSGSTAAASPDDPTGGASQGIGWLVEVLTQEKAVAIGGMVTSRSYQYMADIVAASGDGRAFERYRMVYDISNGTPRVLYWKRMTHLGWPLDPAILTALREGTAAADLPRSSGTTSGSSVKTGLNLGTNTSKSAGTSGRPGSTGGAGRSTF